MIKYDSPIHVGEARIIKIIYKYQVDQIDDTLRAQSIYSVSRDKLRGSTTTTDQHLSIRAYDVILYKNRPH